MPTWWRSWGSGLPAPRKRLASGRGPTFSAEEASLLLWAPVGFPPGEHPAGRDLPLVAAAQADDVTGRQLVDPVAAVDPLEEPVLALVDVRPELQQAADADALYSSPPARECPQGLPLSCSSASACIGATDGYHPPEGGGLESGAQAENLGVAAARDAASPDAGAASAAAAPLVEWQRGLGNVRLDADALVLARRIRALRPILSEHSG